MPKRSKHEQTKHDKKVSQIAKKYERKGYNVKADLPGYNKPESIAGNIPDIKATKGGMTYIIEVETKKSKLSDKSQISTFRRHAGQKPRTKFILEEV